MTYSFASLSPLDFELLVRDLLQAHLGVRFESFASGRDGGVDLRYTRDRSSGLVVQVKHFANSSWPDLQRALSRELPKVQRLAPSPYLIATSQSMTADRKRWILETFAPYIGSPENVYGLEDLNNLLTQHPDVERVHFKLWLTSTNVLERILHSDIFADQGSELAHLESRILRFVSSASLPRALKILNEHAFCVITGVPGIGKTTLAEMIAIDHLKRDFQCFRVWDVRDARRAWRESTNQLFYFDDFLGRTAMRDPNRNEDEQLVRFIHDVAQSTRHKLVLTSRDYILNQATESLEGLRRANLEPSRCVVALSDYTSRARARILYNHLFYSNIPRAHTEALVSSKAHRTIVRHSNYSPRIIEAMTDVLNVRHMPPEQYPKAFLQNLRNPRQLWETAYNNHLTTAAQNALLVATSMPDEALVDDAERVFDALQARRSERYSQPRSPYDWRRALRELEGTFITLPNKYGTLTLNFHNPSIRDFLEHHLRANRADVEDLIASAVFPDQPVRLAQILRGPGNTQFLERLLERYTDLFTAPVASLQLVRRGDVNSLERRDQSPIHRLIAAQPIVARAPAAERARLAAPMVAHVSEYVATAPQNRVELFQLLSSIRESSIPGIDTSHPLFVQTIERAYDDFDPVFVGADNYDAMLTFALAHPEHLRPEQRRRLDDHFEDFASSEIDYIKEESDADQKLEVFDQLVGIAERLGRRISLTREELLEDLEYQREPDYDGEGYSSGGSAGDDMNDADLDNMFDTLVE